MTKVEIIGGSGIAGEHNKDVYTKDMELSNSISVNNSSYNPNNIILTKDFIYSLRNKGKDPYAAHLEVIDRHTLSVLRTFEFKTSDGAALNGIAYKNAKVVVSMGTATNSNIAVFEESVLQNSDLPFISSGNTLASIFFSFTFSGNGSYQNNLQFDGDDSVYVQNQSNVVKLSLSSKAIVWSKPQSSWGVTTPNSISSMKLTQDRVFICLNSGNSFSVLLALSPTDGSLTMQYNLVGILSSSSWYTYGIIGDLENDILILTLAGLWRINKTTLTPVWVKRFPYLLPYIYYAVNIPYNEIITSAGALSAEGSPPKMPDCTIDLSTGRLKKMFSGNNSIPFRYTAIADGKQIYGNYSSYDLVLYTEKRKV